MNRSSRVWWIIVMTLSAATDLAALLLRTTSIVSYSVRVTFGDIQFLGTIALGLCVLVLLPWFAFLLCMKKWRDAFSAIIALLFSYIGSEIAECLHSIAHEFNI